MKLEFLPQVGLGYAGSQRMGDRLNAAIRTPNTDSFKFAVAYMRLSGWQRLASSIADLKGRRGNVVGAVGVDQQVTTVEALEALRRAAPDSTVYYTVSALIFHPKLYVVTSPAAATVFIGSSNLTRDGLYRNMELSVAIHLDLNDAGDSVVFRSFETVLDDFLDTSHSNVKRITPTLLRDLERSGLVGREGSTREPSNASHAQGRTATDSNLIQRLFPPLAVQLAPPPLTVLGQTWPYGPRAPRHGIRPVRYITFVMQLSMFDTSHRTGVPGTPEILIPHEAVPFFPALGRGVKPPSTYFGVTVNTMTDSFKSTYRLWYYGARDEYRLRTGRRTADLTTPGGGDLIAISRLPSGSPTPYEVTILSRQHPDYAFFQAKCTRSAGTKVWGFV